MSASNVKLERARRFATPLSWGEWDPSNRPGAMPEWGAIIARAGSIRAAFDALRLDPRGDERCEQRTVSYDIAPRGGERVTGLLRVIAASHRTASERILRTAIMSAARRIESERRARLIASQRVTVPTPLEALRIEQGLGRYQEHGTVSELVQRYEQGHRRQTFTVTAPGYMIALERLYTDYRNEHRFIDGIARCEPHNDGRGAVAVRIADAVNGTETRTAERWHRTPLRALRAERFEWNGGESGSIRCDGEHRAAPRAASSAPRLDRTCYRVMPDGSRVPLVSTATAKRRKATSTAKRVAVTAASLAPIGNEQG